MSPGGLVRAIWLAMGVLSWSQFNTVTGFQTSIGERSSSRLLELIQIASRINHEDIARHKRLIADRADVNSGVDIAQSPDQLVERKTRNVRNSPHSIQSRSVRKRRETAWDNLRSSYQTFYRCLTTFVTDFLGKLKPGSPPELQYVTDIPDIIPDDDIDFFYQREDPVVERVVITIGLTERLLHSAGKYVYNSTWFNEEGTKLRVWMALVKLNLVNVRLEDNPDPIDYYRAGIGDINLGSENYRPVNVDHLKALLIFLRNNGR